MPLTAENLQNTVFSKISSSRSQDQAVAAALRTSREGIKRGADIKIHKGPIHSTVAGRTDHLPMHVHSGSYVIPADIISAMGEGNSMAGFKVAKSIFSVPGPYGKPTGEMPYDQPSIRKASGGEVDAVPIVAAGGEYVISPEEVQNIGGSSMEHGHKILDLFVKKMRKNTIKTLQSLPGPQKD